MEEKKLVGTLDRIERSIYYYFRTDSKHLHNSIIIFTLGSIQMLSNPGLEVGDRVEIKWYNGTLYSGWFLGKKINERTKV